eukprot:1806502-Prymnesium_polylepis.1
MGQSRFIALTVRPNESCKIELPPCSALDIKHAALATDGRPSQRCVLECELATHSFVLCSIPPNAPLQASLGTVITNDPAEEAWMFLRARGSCAFHVLGRLEVDDDGAAEPPKKVVEGEAPRKAAKRAKIATPAGNDSVDLSDSGWALGAPKSSAAMKDAKEADFLASGND